MKIINLLAVFLLISCSKKIDIEQSMKNELIERESIDSVVWDVKNILIKETSDVQVVADYSSCKESLIQYSIELKENCFERTALSSILDKNVVIKAIKDILSIDNIKQKVYQINQCQTEKYYSHLIAKEKEKMKNKIGTKKCIQKKSILSSECVLYAPYETKDFNREIDELERSTSLELSKMKMRKKGEEIIRKDTLVYCYDKENKIIFQ